MTEHLFTNLASLWARAGAMFLADPAPTSPDLERLLLETARQASGNSRLFTMAASWLAKYNEKIKPLRLADLIWQDLEEEYRPIMGLLLDTAQHLSGRYPFAAAMAACAPAPEPRPLFDIERRNASLRRRSQRRASKLSQAWNVWAADVEPKYDAIRPESWVNLENPSYNAAFAY